MLTTLTCPWCGAPLPAASADANTQPFLRCAYCGATSTLSGVRAVKAQPSATAPSTQVSDPNFYERVIEAFQSAMKGGASAYDALQSAARARLGAMGQTEAFARVCLALARDFDDANGTSTVTDAMCMARMIEVYLRAIEGVRTSGSFTINLPFFTATPRGPVHFERTLTAEIIAALAERPPSAPPKKKKGFWPFG